MPLNTSLCSSLSSGSGSVSPTCSSRTGRYTSRLIGSRPAPPFISSGERLSRRASIGQQVTARQRLECAQHFQQRRLFRRPESPRLRDRCGILRRYRKPDHFDGLVVHAAFPVVREPEPRRQHRLHGVIHGAEESVTDEERELYQFLVQYRCGVEHGIYAFEVLPLALIRDREDDPLAAPIALAERQAHPRPREAQRPAALLAQDSQRDGQCCM